MTFVARSAASIRDEALRGWRARHLIAGRDLDISPGSDAYMEMDAISLELEGVELGARDAAYRVLLRFQHGEDLDMSAEDDGTARKPATKGRRTVTIHGPANASAPINGATLSASNGVRLVPVDATTGAVLTSTPTTDGSGDAEMTVEAAVEGSAPNALALNSLLTWSSAPTSFGSTATLGPVTVSGQDAETDISLRTRLLFRRADRPGGGNRAWWHETLFVVAGVGELFVYRVMTAAETYAGSGVYNYRPNRAGNVTVIPFAPRPTSYAEGGDGMFADESGGFSRIPSPTLVSHVLGYLRGTLDRNGNAPGTGLELYPAHMTEGSFFVVPPAGYTRNVVLSVRAGDDWRWPTEANTVDVSGSTDTELVCAVPIVSWQVGDRIAIADWSGHRIRGGWFLRRIVNVDAMTRTLTLDTALPGAPPFSTPIRSDAVGPGNLSLWEAIRTVIAGNVFDLLGPGTAPSQSFRYPKEARDSHPSPLNRSSVLREVLNVDGVSDASVDSPGANENAPVGGVFVLGNLRVDRMP